MSGLHRSEIQSVLFSKKTHQSTIIDTLNTFHITPIKEPHETEHFIRIRIHDPKKYKYFETFVYKPNIKFVIGYY